MASRRTALPHTENDYDPYGNITIADEKATVKSVKKDDSEKERASRFGGRILLDKKDQYLHNAWYILLYDF